VAICILYCAKGEADIWYSGGSQISIIIYLNVLIYRCMCIHSAVYAKTDNGCISSTYIVRTMGQPIQIRRYYNGVVHRGNGHTHTRHACIYIICKHPSSDYYCSIRSEDISSGVYICNRYLRRRRRTVYGWHSATGKVSV